NILVVKCYLVLFSQMLITRCFLLSLHDALPFSSSDARNRYALAMSSGVPRRRAGVRSMMLLITFSGTVLIMSVPEKVKNSIIERDRKSTRLNSSHVKISYAVFCLQKKQYLLSNL